MTQTHKDNWEERFEKRYPWLAIALREDYVDFFRSELLAYQQRVIDTVESMIKNQEKIHDEAMPNNTLIAYHADSSIRALVRAIEAIKNLKP